MARNLTNTNTTTNVYLNRDPIDADLPVLATQPTTSDPITISLKGLPTSFSGYANKVIKVKTDESGLEYATDSDTTLWTEAGSNVYPKNVGQVIINTTSNTNNRNLLVNGTGDIVGNLHFGNNNDIYIKALGQNLRNYAGYSTGTGGSHLFYVKQSNNVATEVGSIKTGSITNIGNANVSSGNSQLNLYSASNQSVEIKNNDGGGVGGSPFLSIECQNDNSGQGTSDYYVKWVLEGNEKMRLTTSGLSNVSWLGNTISVIYGGTGNTSYSTGDILYASASNTLSKLSIGNTDQVLTVIGGVPTWQDTAVPDLTTSTNFGTAVQSGTIKMGNSSGNSYTANIELYVDSKLSIFNTNNVEVAKFEPATNTCDLSLFGGVLSNATIGSNTQYLGTAITYNYGGTGLSILTANKILQVNSNANGYNLVDMPTGQTYTVSTPLSLSGSNVISIANLSGFGTSGQILSTNGSDTISYVDAPVDTNFFNIDSSNNISPKNANDRLVIGGGSSASTSEGLVITNQKKSYFRGVVDIYQTNTETDLYMRSSDNIIYMTTGDSNDMSSSQGIRLRNSNGNTNSNVFNIDRIANGLAYSKMVLNMASGGTEFKLVSTDITTIQFEMETGSERFTYQADPNAGVFDFTYRDSVSSVNYIYTYSEPSDLFTLNPVLKFGSSTFKNAGNHSITLPTTAGTLALNTISARLGSFTGFGCVYDPFYVLTPSATNSAFFFAANGSTTRLNCRVDNGGSSSNHGLDFAGTNVFRFDSNGTINVKNSGQSQYAFNTPNTSGTLALIDQVQEKADYIRLGDITSGSNNYGILYNPQYTKSLANAYLKYHTNGTDLRLNCRSGSSSNIFFDYGNSNVFKFTSSGSIQVGNNKMTSNASYGFQFEGVANRQISIPIGTYFPYIGASSSHPYVLHINGIGDAYRLTGTSTSNLRHEFVYGRVGIGISSPAVPLHIQSQSGGGGTFTSGFYARSQAAGSGFASANGYQYWNNDPISIVGEGGAYFKSGYIVASDERIKTNIEDVPDNLALDYLRNIPCRYYEYIDKTRGYDKTIGFVAQEVRKVFPLAVSIGEEIIPDVYKNINCIWTEKDDKFILSSPDLTNVNGIEYLFYGLNEGETEEERIAVVGDEDNTFTFDKKFDTVFCYGSEVKDFNRLSHEKLFTLNFSATQEIDKIQQQHKIEIDTLKTENETLKEELEGLKSELALIKELLTKNNIV